jgi:hypothetical protein
VGWQPHAAAERAQLIFVVFSGPFWADVKDPHAEINLIINDHPANLELVKVLMVPGGLG